MKHVYIILLFSSFHYPLMQLHLAPIYPIKKAATYYADQDYENALNETLSLQNNFPEGIIIIWAK